MILADTDVLSAMAKISRLPLLISLFEGMVIYLTPGVLAEMTHSLNLGRQYAIEVLTLVTDGQMQVISPMRDEAAFGENLPASLGIGERESIAVARSRGGTVLSNESRIAHYCRQYRIHACGSQIFYALFG